MDIYELCAWHFYFLTFCSLSENGVSEVGVCVLVEALKVNQSHQKLKLKLVQPFMSNTFKRYTLSL